MVLVLSGRRAIAQDSGNVVRYAVSLALGKAFAKSVFHAGLAFHI
jgi:hypothetical protein